MQMSEAMHSLADSAPVRAVRGRSVGHGMHSCVLFSVVLNDPTGHLTQLRTDVARVTFWNVPGGHGLGDASPNSQ